MASTVWRGRLAFGMVAIPVRLYKAARRERIRFHQVYRPARPAPGFDPDQAEEDFRAPKEVPAFIRGSGAGGAPVPAQTGLTKSSLPPEVDEESAPVARVRQAPMPETGEAPLAKPEILKGYELERDRYVVLDPAEVAALRPRTSTELEIAEFVKPEEIDPIYYDASYYIAADRGGEKPYALLFRTLSESGYAGIGALAMHGREYFVAIRPGSRGLVLHTLFHANEVGREEEYAADPALVSAKELEMARMLVNALAGKFDPSRLKDALEVRLKQLIESRAELAVTAGPGSPAPKMAPVVDIMEALRRSLEAARKPVRSESSAPAAARKRAKRR